MTRRTAPNATVEPVDSRSIELGIGRGPMSNGRVIVDLLRAARSGDMYARAVAVDALLELGYPADRARRATWPYVDPVWGAPHATCQDRLSAAREIYIWLQLEARDASGVMRADAWRECLDAFRRHVRNAVVISRTYTAWEQDLRLVVFQNTTTDDAPVVGLGEIATPGQLYISLDEGVTPETDLGTVPEED